MESNHRNDLLFVNKAYTQNMKFAKRFLREKILVDGGCVYIYFSF